MKCRGESTGADSYLVLTFWKCAFDLKCVISFSFDPWRQSMESYVEGPATIQVHVFEFLLIIHIGFILYGFLFSTFTDPEGNILHSGSHVDEKEVEGIEQKWFEGKELSWFSCLFMA